MTTLPGTPAQTVGPFFRYGLEFEGSSDLVPAGSTGALHIVGRVFDGAGAPIPDALIELWQADASGAIPAAEGTFHRDGHTFTGFGRCHTDEHGGYEFWTVLPDADFLAIVVFARGLLDRLHTRLYLPGRSDAFLESLDPSERATLQGVPIDGGLRFDIHLQGDSETVFLVFD